MSTMKRISSIFGGLLFCAALTISCQKENVDSIDTVEKETTSITIPYTVTVQQNDETKVSVAYDERTLRFDSTDQLIISGENISGTLDLVSGAGQSTAVFSGDLTYSGLGSPAPELVLTATLNSVPDYSSSIGGAFDLVVKNCSHITGTSTYGARSFSLQQSSAFIKFHIRVTSYSEIEMPVGVNVATISDRNSYSVSGNVYFDGTSLSFTVAFPGGTVLNKAVLSINGNVIKLGGASQTLEANKVYRFEKTIPSVTTPNAVDLGLSVKWADINIGAKNPEDRGDYYAWGELLPYYKYGNTFAVTPVWRTGKNKGYAWDSNRLVEYYDSGTYTITLSKYNASDGKTVLELSDDVAHSVYGGNWRMPTNAECLELISGCNWTSKTINGVLGFEVSSKTNSNSIFLPLTGGWSGTIFYGPDSGGTQGLYWTSTRHESEQNEAYYLTLNNPDDSYYITHPERLIITQAFERNLGWAVRAVSTE